MDRPREQKRMKTIQMTRDSFAYTQLSRKRESGRYMDSVGNYRMIQWMMYMVGSEFPIDSNFGVLYTPLTCQQPLFPFTLLLLPYPHWPSGAVCCSAALVRYV